MRARSLVGFPWRHPGAADAVLAALLVALAQAEVWLAGSTDAPRPVLAVAAGAMLSLAWRRRAPVASATIAAGTVMLVAAFWRLDGAWWALALMLAVYSVAAHAEFRPALLGAAMALIAHALAALQDDTSGAIGDFVGNYSFPVVVLVGIPWLAGRALRSRRLHADVLEDRAEALERESAERARAAVAEERLRIARELHDVVGHSLGVIVVQAGAERATLAPGQETTRETLATIERTGREALGEMRRLLDMMRRDDEQVALAPQPSLVHLDALVEKVRRAGLPIELLVEGEPAPLPSGVDLSAYRIVQEALTNALKHAGPARARSPSATPTAASSSTSSTTGWARRRPTIAPDTASSEWVSGWRSTAGRCAPGRSPAAATRSAYGCRSRSGEDERRGPDLRRPGAGARRLFASCSKPPRRSTSWAKPSTVYRPSSSPAAAHRPSC